MSKETPPILLEVEQSAQDFPVLPLRDVVVYPHMVVPLFVGRKRSICALDRAMIGSKEIVLVTQKSPAQDEPEIDGIYRYGTVASIIQLLKLPDGTTKLLVEGTHRAKVESIREEDNMYVATVVAASLADHGDPGKLEPLQNSAMHYFEQYVKLNKKIPAELITSLNSTEEPSRFADTIAAHLIIKLEEKQNLLELVDVAKRLERLIQIMESEIDLLQVERRIRGRVKKQMEKSQREYYLNEQMKAIQQELGDMEDGQSEADVLEKKIHTAGMRKEARERALSELGKLKLMQPMSAEATVVRNYLDWLLKVPWKKRSKISCNVRRAAEILDEDHYGLEKVKERILEYLAVQQRVKKIKGPILCLVGPPGVGKTSLGRSIARATNRKFVRVSLGGVRDEAEIRGHRRTYIGSMPGKIIQSMARVEHKNPLFLLDEVDKMAMDFRGDPASALLEVLDPEQNTAFNDHYLEVDYDLSEVMFITTANSVNIPHPLLDRMEVIRLSGYTEDEKLNIARQYLLPKQIGANGLNAKEIMVRDKTVRDIVRYYTREAGVRNLEREIANICRKVVKQILMKPTKRCQVITPTRLAKLLGVRRFRFGHADDKDRIGQVVGLAWTETGGDLLTVEAAVLPGKGKTIQTGKLGAVMKESIEAAVTVVRSRSAVLGIQEEFYKDSDLHVHVPEGAVPKDGPSAGIAMCTALVSALTGIRVKSTVAMTGEITLRGEILPIGGLKEKLLAALRGGIETVLIPCDNARELVEIPKNIKQSLDIIAVRWIDEALAAALHHVPLPNDATEKSKRVIRNRGKATATQKSIRPH